MPLKQAALVVPTYNRYTTKPQQSIQHLIRWVEEVDLDVEEDSTDQVERQVEALTELRVTQKMIVRIYEKVTRKLNLFHII